MATLDLVLAAAVLFLGAAVLLLLLRDGDDEIDEKALRSSMGEAISEIGLDGTASQIELHAREMKTFHSDVEKLLRTPQARGGFGEVQLEVILGDQLPEDMYGIREAVVGSKIPDAYVRTREGIVCIDSKFPLEAFERYLDAEDEAEAARHASEFAGVVEDELEKIRVNYVRPQDGTTGFAFAFIPSERVYYHLVTEEYDLLRDYATAGVQVVSPLTLTQKLELVKAGVHARKLSEQAEAVQKRLQRLGQKFEDFEDNWDTFMGHMDRAKKRADGADSAYRKLREQFDDIEGLSGEEASDEGLTGSNLADDRQTANEPASESE